MSDPRALAIALLGLSACADPSGSEPPAPEPPPPAFDAAPAVEILPAARFRDLGIDAWDAVIERDRLLARRGDGGVVRGRLGDPVDGYRWLVDTSEGDGALAIRVALPAWASDLDAGTLVALGGAWQVADDRRWYWDTDAVTAFSDAPPPTLTEPPGLAPRPIPELPAEAVPPSALTRDGLIAYYILAPPVKAGDGWAIADDPAGDPVGWLVLPGERPIYGGQDLRTDDERWSLAPGTRYLVPARRLRRPLRPNDPPVFLGTGTVLTLVTNGDAVDAGD